MCVCVCVRVRAAQSCLTFYNTMDCSLPGSSVNRIFQARKLEWVAISFSRGSFQPRDWICIGRQDLYHCEAWKQGKCYNLLTNTQHKKIKCDIRLWKEGLKTGTIVGVLSCYQHKMNRYIYICIICLCKTHGNCLTKQCSRTKQCTGATKQSESNKMALGISWYLEKPREHFMQRGMQ